MLNFVLMPIAFCRGEALTNRPGPSSKNSHFENEAKCTTFLVKMSFICVRMKNHFHIKGWTLNLVLIQRPGGTRKWPIDYNIIEAFNAAVNLNFIFIACAQGSRRQCLRDIFFFFTSQLCFCGRLPQQTTSEKRTQKFHTGDGSPGTKGFTWWKWIIGYNFGIDDGAESKFGASKELTVLKISKYKYCANKSRDKSRDHFAKNCKLLTNWWPV